jgi:hypothetical protein
MTRFSVKLVFETFSLSGVSIPIEHAITILQISRKTVFRAISFGQNLPDYPGTFTLKEGDVFPRQIWRVMIS